MTKVWKCDRPSNQTLVLLAMADFASDDGSRCYPSIALLAWKCGYSSRQIQNIIRELRAKSILLVLDHDQGGRSHSTEYLIRLSHIAPKSEFQSTFAKALAKGEIISPFSPNHKTAKGEICDGKGCNLEHERVKSTTQRVQFTSQRVNPTSPNTLVTVNETLTNSSVEERENQIDTETTGSQFWDRVLIELQSQVTRPSYETWFKETRCSQLSAETATILVVNTFIRDMLNDRLYSLISMACSKVPPYPKEIMFEIDSGSS